MRNNIIFLTLMGYPILNPFWGIFSTFSHLWCSQSNKICLQKTYINFLSSEWKLPKWSTNNLFYSLKNWDAWAEINEVYDKSKKKPKTCANWKKTSWQKRWNKGFGQKITQWEIYKHSIKVKSRYLLKKQNNLLSKNWNQNEHSIWPKQKKYSGKKNKLNSNGKKY